MFIGWYVKYSKENAFKILKFVPAKRQIFNEDQTGFYRNVVEVMVRGIKESRLFKVGILISYDIGVFFSFFFINSLLFLMGRVVKLTAVLFLLAKSIEPETSHGDKVTLSVKKVLKCFRGKNFILNKYIKENTSKAL